MTCIILNHKFWTPCLAFNSKISMIKYRNGVKMLSLVTELMQSLRIHWCVVFTHRWQMDNDILDPLECAQGLVLLVCYIICFSYLIWFMYSFSSRFLLTGTEAIISLPNCQWGNPEGYRAYHMMWMSRFHWSNPEKLWINISVLVVNYGVSNTIVIETP